MTLSSHSPAAAPAPAALQQGWGLPRSLEGLGLRLVQGLLILVGSYAILTNLAGLGFRVALLGSGEAGALFRDSALSLGLRVGSSALVALVYCTFAAALAQHKARDAYAALTALTFFTTATTAVDLSPALGARWVVHVHPVFSALNTALLLYLLLLFPNARFRSKAQMLLGHGWLAFCLLCLLFPALPFNVVYFETWAQTPLLSLLVDFSPFVLAFFALFRAQRLETEMRLRQQGFWFALGATTLFVGMLSNFAIRGLPADLLGALGLEVVRPFLLNLVLLALPLCLGWAHYRWGLFGGEVVLEQTLARLLLALVLLGIYVALLSLLGALSVGSGLALVLVVSAAMLALLLQPLYRAIRQSIGKMLHGQSRDPYGVLSGLAGRLELSGNPEEALVEIGHTLERDLRFPAGGLEVDLQGERRAVHRWGREARNLAQGRSFELTADGEGVGQLWVVSSRDGFSHAELELLRDVARHTGRVMQSLRLRLELQRSREQRVQGFEAELKRLRNDLHDGVAPTLVALTRRLDVALELSGEEQQRLLGQVQDDLLGSVRDLRRVIYGLRPPALDELGLLGALEECAHRLPFPVQLELPESLSISAAVEVALYRIASEALSNVQKHSGARRAALRLHLRGPLLELEIEDDGQGFSASRLGIGLRSMRERAEELGGTLRVWSKSEAADPAMLGALGAQGTCVRVSLPWKSVQGPLSTLP